MKKIHQGGYVGLIILLISVAVIGLLFMFTVMSPETENENQENIGRTDFDKAQKTIEYGKEAENTMNSYTDSLSKEIENM